MVVPSRPLFKPALFCEAKLCNTDSFERGFEFYPLGRHALLASLTKVGARPGDAIVFPAYYCESTLRILREYGFRLEYVDVGQDLQLDENRVALLCKAGAVRALVIVHYFGLRTIVSARLRDLCKRNGVHIIEDYSHSFLTFAPSMQADGTSAFVFSMRKTVTVPDGGALLMRAPGGATSGKNRGARPHAGRLAYLPFLIRGYIEALCVRVGRPNIYGRGMDELKRLAVRVCGEAGGEINGAVNLPVVVQPSRFLRRILCDRDGLKEIAARRRGNYQQLYSELRNIRGIEFLSSDAGDSVPFAFPILVSAEGLLEHLRRSGIGAFRWPGEDMPLEVKDCAGYFPNASGVNDRVICMPIHQDVTRAQISYMVDAVKSFFDKKAISGGHDIRH